MAGIGVSGGRVLVTAREGYLDAILVRSLPAAGHDFGSPGIALAMRMSATRERS